MTPFDVRFDRKALSTTRASDFASRLYGKVAVAQPGQNLFLSPFSIQVALAMCAAGARGQTRQVIADLINAPECIDEQNRQYAEVIRSFHGEGERPFELVVANALWHQTGYEVLPDFVKAITDFYSGAIHEVDFVGLPGQAVEMINGWVSDKTQGKNKGIIQRNAITTLTRLVLTNAIYFKGLWDKDFKRAATSEDTWFGSRSNCEIPMMHRTGTYLYFEREDLQAIQLPYKGGQLAMLVVLPTQKDNSTKGDGLPALESRWAQEDLYGEVLNGLRIETVNVAMPRFKIEAEFSLNSVLSKMGAALAFSDQADFTGMGEVPLKLSDIVHKAYVEVNEEGTEAAAATMMSALRGRVPQNHKYFCANHPFLFLIKDLRTHAVLFAGRLSDPT